MCSLLPGTAVFAIFDLQMFVLKWLAVAGGGAIGFFATGWCIRVFGRVFFFRKSQPPGYNAVRSLGMFGLGLLVYLWAFGAGGGGFGGMGGWRPFGGPGGTGTDQSASGQSPENPIMQKVPEIIEKERAAARDVIQVRLTGGKDVVDQRFYRIGGEKQALNWDELVLNLTVRRQSEPNLKVVEIVLYQWSVDRDNPAVQRLEKWAIENRLTPKFIIHGVDVW
jgi:hypothetical protein